MQRGSLDELLAFVAVGRERSFTKAAASWAFLSPRSATPFANSKRSWEFLTRTTRSVSPTEAGERLLRTVGPRFEEIEAELAALNELRQKPAGTIRITAGDHS